jgi:hypothetical protein
VKYPKGLNAPQVRNTTIQVVVNADCFQIEFGMSAALPNFSCRFIHNTKAGIRARAVEKIAMFCGSFMLVELPVIALL